MVFSFSKLLNCRTDEDAEGEELFLSQPVACDTVRSQLPVTYQFSLSAIVNLIYHFLESIKKVL